MSESTLKLIELVKQQKTSNEIAQELNISNKQLFNRLLQLKNLGFDFKRKYYYSGDIVYSFYNDILISEPSNSVDIITSPEDQEIEAVVISDLHLGSVDERVDLLNKVYDYCIKNNIHTILNAGDIIDGMCGTGEKIHNNIFEQIEYAIKMYPFDKSILNYTVLGNHDFNSLFSSGKDLALVLQNYRHDIIPVGYGTAEINIKNDKIVLRHPLLVSNNEFINQYNHVFMLKGHYYTMEIKHDSSGNCFVKVPSLSNINFTDNYGVPSALKIRLIFRRGVIWRAIIEQLLIGKNIFVVNSIDLDLYMGKKINDNDEIRLEEKKKVLALEKPKVIRTNQIDRFNARYGIK